MDSYIDWKMQFVSQGKTPTAQEEAEWLSAHPFEDAEEYFYALRSVYERMFDGDCFGLGYGAPETYEGCNEIMLECFRRGESFSPYDWYGIPEDAVF